MAKVEPSDPLQMSSSRPTCSTAVLFCLFLVLGLAMASFSPQESKVYIVHMEKTSEEADKVQARQLGTLASVLGSSEAAQEALLYHYTHSIHGFSARLTEDQANAVSQLPGVLQVSESKAYQLHGSSRVPGV